MLHSAGTLGGNDPNSRAAPERPSAGLRTLDEFWTCQLSQVHRLWMRPKLGRTILDDTSYYRSARMLRGRRPR